MKIALDAGHGRKPDRPHTGAVGCGLIEDEIALEMVKRIGHYLRAAGHKTIYTRPDEIFVPIAARGAKAISTNCDLFISIHANAGEKSANGVEAFVKQGDTRSKTLAKKPIRAIASLGLKNRGVKWDTQSHCLKLGVLRATSPQMPAMLIEIGFITNPSDAAKLSDKFFRDKMARAIAGSVGG